MYILDMDVVFHARNQLCKTTNCRRRAFPRNVDFSFIVSGSDRTFTFRVSLNTLPTLATLVRDAEEKCDIK